LYLRFFGGVAVGGCGVVVVVVVVGYGGFGYSFGLFILFGFALSWLRLLG